MILPNYLSFKILVTLIKAMLTNIGRPGTYAEEVKKDLKAANPKVDVPINVDSRPLPGYPSFSAHWGICSKTTNRKKYITQLKTTPSVHLKERQLPITQVMETAISPMETETGTANEKAQISMLLPEPTTAVNKRKRIKPVKAFVWRNTRRPYEHEADGCTWIQKYANYNKNMLRKETRTGNVKVLFINKDIWNQGQKKSMEGWY